jgi:hypothetical protein
MARQWFGEVEDTGLHGLMYTIWVAKNFRMAEATAAGGCQALGLRRKKREKLAQPRAEEEFKNKFSRC